LSNVWSFGALAGTGWIGPLRRFDEEFQRDAVKMLESGERTAKQLSQELGVSLWRRDNTFGGNLFNFSDT
jgi:hypothetical protein